MEEKYDILKMYFEKDYYVADNIKIHQPTIGEIIDFGESRFWNMITAFCANPTSVRLELWNQGIDWNEVDDFELFISLTTSFPIENTSIIFGDIDFTKFNPIKTDDGKLVIVNMAKPEIQIDEEIYRRLVRYLRVMFNIHPKVEKAKNQATKEAIIFEEEMNLKIALKKAEKEIWQKSMLFPLISAALNHPGFKYKKKELEEVGIVEFMDSIKRLQVYESTTSLMTGMYMGMVDLKGMDLTKELNWARDIYD